MVWKEIVGARFSPAEFDDYVRGLLFTTWRPQFVVVHNTGVPSLADRPVGFTPQHIANLVTYYRDGQGWDSGPHCFVDQNGIWVFTPLTETGTHSPSWNSISWGIETLGAYETEAFTDPVHEHLVACLATLHAVMLLDANTLRFHKEDAATTHKICPGKNLNKISLIHDVRALMSARQTLAAPASGRYTGRSYADVAPQSHFFADHGALAQTDAIAYGPLSTDKENKFRLTGLVTATSAVTANVHAYATVSGMVMIQRVADPNTAGAWLPNVVNLVLKPYKQPIQGFTRVKYFLYRNLRLDAFLQGTTEADQALVRAETGASPFIQRLWGIHKAQNGTTAAFPSTVLGFDPANQPDADGIDAYFHRENENEQLPFAALGERIGAFHRAAITDAFGLEIILEGEEPDYAHVRASTETFIDATSIADGIESQLKRARILNFIDPAAFYGMHMSPGGWLEVQSGASKTKLQGISIYDDVVQRFATANTLYIDLRNENGRALDFYGAYDDGSGNDLEIGTSAASLAAQPYASDKWPILIRKCATETTANDYSLVALRLRRDYNRKPILYLLHGQFDAPPTKGRFIAGGDLFDPANDKTNVLSFRHPNKDLGGGQRIGVAWLIRADYALRLDPANLPFPDTVVPTTAHYDNLFGPIDAIVPWRTTEPVIAWATGQDKKYVDGQAVAALGFEHVADRGVAFSSWDTSAPAAGGTVLFYGAAKDSFLNTNKELVPHNGIASGISHRESIFDEAMLFDGYGVEYASLTDGAEAIRTLALTETQPYSRPADAMLMLGLTRSEVDDQLAPLIGLDIRYPRNVLLEEIAGSPLTDADGVTYRKYRAGLRGIKTDGNADQLFPAPDLHVYSVDRKFFFSKALAFALPVPVPLSRDAEEAKGEKIRKGDVYVITAVSGATVTIKPNSVAPHPFRPDEPEVDFRREIVPDDRITILGASFDVLTVAMSGKNGVITLDHAPGAIAIGTDKLYCPNKPREDYFIAKDRLGVLSTLARMEVLVEEFITKVNAIPDAASAQAALQLLVDDYGPKIFKRACLICSDQNFAYADDRILYWARIKMAVTLKNHPYLKGNKSVRNALRKSFDTKSRGYDSVSFAGAGTKKKVLVTGFDPFQIDKNEGQGNPSGAAALALHGGNSPKITPTIHVQSAIFPVRHADFGDDDKNKHQHVIEDFFTSFITDPLKRPDLIVTLSQAGGYAFYLERFAGRTRSTHADNLDASHPEFPPSLVGSEFYETTLPATKIIPTGNKSGNFKVYYNNQFKYREVYPDNSTKAVYEYGGQPDSGALNLEDTGHPDKASFAHLVPTKLDGTTVPKLSDIRSITGSGSNYLSNEIFYRVSRLRDIHNNTQNTGHLHVPIIQHPVSLTVGATTSDPKVGSTKGLRFNIVKEVIDEIVNCLVRAFS